MNRYSPCVCNGDNACPGCNEEVAKAMTAEIAAADARYEVPPCLDCGAATSEEAQGKCICAGDRDDCHGCYLWPES